MQPTEPLSNAYLTWIIVGCGIAFVLCLLGIARWAVNQVIGEVKAIPDKFEKMSIVISELSTSVKELTTEVSIVREKQKADDAAKIRHEHYMHQEIEMLRDSRHALYRFVSAIRAKLESVFKGTVYEIKFEGEWKLPEMIRERNFPFRDPPDPDDIV